jgi:type IV secretion system protein VirB10
MAGAEASVPLAPGAAIGSVDTASRDALAGVPAIGAATKSPGQLALERRLSGPAFARQADAVTATTEPNGLPQSSIAAGPGAPEAHDHEGSGRAGDIGGLLAAASTPTMAARTLPTQRLLLAKGAFIDCTLETALDSTLPGMTTCITATDTFSADGTVVLLERGSKLIGETRGQVQQGSARVFVLWTEARTPSGVVVPLESPGTDELGRSGLAGQVDRHFWDRFGAAILITVIDGAVQAAARSSGGTLIINPSSSQDVITEVLRGTINIAPTVRKNQGDRIQVLVARDLDFRSVYELRARAERR